MHFFWLNNLSVNIIGRYPKDDLQLVCVNLSDCHDGMMDVSFYLECTGMSLNRGNVTEFLESIESI